MSNVVVRELKDYSELRVGDCLPSQENPEVTEGNTGYRTGRVREVYNDSVEVEIGFRDGDTVVHGDQIKDVAFFRPSDGGLEILAGERVMDLFEKQMKPDGSQGDRNSIQKIVGEGHPDHDTLYWGDLPK